MNLSFLLMTEVKTIILTKYSLRSAKYCAHSNQPYSAILKSETDVHI